MASDSGSPSPKPSGVTPNPPSKEDAETSAAREELRNTRISEPDKDGCRSDAPNREEHPLNSRDQLPSPKKKRGHDQLDTSDSSGNKEVNNLSYKEVNSHECDISMHIAYVDHICTR